MMDAMVHEQAKAAINKTLVDVWQTWPVDKQDVVSILLSICVDLVTNRPTPLPAATPEAAASVDKTATGIELTANK